MTSPSAPQPTAQTKCFQPPVTRTFSTCHHPMLSTPDPQLRPKMLLVRLGTKTDPAAGAITTSIRLSATHGHPGLGESAGCDYAHAANPTRNILQNALARLEDGTAAFVLSSGMAALELAIHTPALRDSRIMVLRSLYGDSFRFLEVLAEGGAANVDFVLNLKSLREALAGPADLVIIETFTNPTMEEISIPEAAELAHAAGAKLAVDGTFYTPVVQRSPELGANVVVHSGIKYLGGHNDIMTGVAVVTDDALVEQLDYRLSTIGATLDPFDRFLLLCGPKTLVLRTECHKVNATAIAQSLRSSPYVTRVLYPGHSDMVNFDLVESMDMARFLASVRVFIFAKSLGGVRSLVACPPMRTRADMPVGVRASYGLVDRFMRPGVDIGHVDDLIADSVQIFEVAHTRAQAEPEY